MAAKGRSGTIKGTDFWPVERRLVMTEPNIPAARLLCFRLTRSQYNKDSQKMCSFKKTSDGQDKITESLFLFFLEMIRRMDKEINELPIYREFRNSSERAQKPWMNAYMEFVPHKESDAKRTELDTLFENICRSDPEIDKKYIFWAPNTRVSEMRIWIAVEDEYYSLAGVIEGMLKDADEKRHSFGESRDSARRKTGMSNTSGASQLDPTGAVTMDSFPYQRWNKLSNINELLSALSLYYQNKRLVDDPKWLAALATDPVHPINPYTAFNPLHPFALVNMDDPGLPECCEKSNYIVKGQKERMTTMVYDPVTKQNKEFTTERARIALKFPHPEFVIGPLKASDLSPRVMINRNTPWYQFDTLFREYCTLAKKSRPVSRLYLRAAKARRNNFQLGPVGANEQDADEQVDALVDHIANEAEAQGGVISNAEGPVALSRDKGPNDEEVQASSSYWMAEAEDLGIGSCVFSSYSDIPTHMLADRELRNGKEIINDTGQIAGESTNPLVHIRNECDEDWKKTYKNVDAQLEIYWHDRTTGSNGYDPTCDEFSELADKKQVREAMVRRSYEDHKETVARKLAVHIREDSELQQSDAVYASFGASLLGKVLSDELNFVLPIFDPDLSAFGHLMAWMMEQFEHVCLVANVHTILLKLFFGRLTCLRKKNDMVYNVLIYGDRMLSKSFILDLVTEWSIPSTAVPYMDMSTRATNTDEHRDGLVMIIHELSEDITSTKSKIQGGKKEVSSLKDRMTSGFTRYICFETLPDGTRSNRVIQASYIQCYFLATNESIRDMDLALLSRVDLILATDAKSILRENKTLPNLSMVKDNLPASVLRERVRFTKYAHIMQYLHWQTEQFIADGSLKEPTLFCTTAALGSVSQTMADARRDEADSRTRSRIMMIAREIVINMGIIYLFFAPDAPYLNEPFNIDLLCELDPFLVDTDEIAVFVLGLFSDTIEKPERSYVQKALALYFMDNMKTSDTALNSFRYLRSSNVPHVPIRQGHSGNNQNMAAANAPGSPNPYGNDVSDDTEMARVAAQAEANAARARAARSAAPVQQDVEMEDEADIVVPDENGAVSQTSITDDLLREQFNQNNDDDNQTQPPQFEITQERKAQIDGREYDFNYVVFPHKPYAMASVLQNIMDNHPEKFPVRMGIPQIHDVLNEFKAASSAVPKYGTDASVSVYDILCGRKRPQKLNETCVSAHQLIVTEHGTDVSYDLIRTGLTWINKGCESLLEIAIKNIQHKYTREQKILYGRAQEGAPFVLRTWKLAKNDKRILTILNPFFKVAESLVMSEQSYKTKLSETNVAESIFGFDDDYLIVLECSVENECMRRRLAALHIPVSDPNSLDEFSIYQLDKKMKEYAFAKGAKKIKYPEEYIINLKNKIKNARRRQNGVRPRVEPKRGETEEVRRLFANVNKRRRVVQNNQ